MSSGIRRHVICYKFISLSEKGITSISRVEELMYEREAAEL